MKNWPNDINETVKNLNEQLKIDHNDWHKFKGNKNKRAAELISSALCRLGLQSVWGSAGPAAAIWGVPGGNL